MHVNHQAFNSVSHASQKCNSNVTTWSEPDQLLHQIGLVGFVQPHGLLKELSAVRLEFALPDRYWQPSTSLSRDSANWETGESRNLLPTLA